MIPNRYNNEKSKLAQIPNIAFFIKHDQTMIFEGRKSSGGLEIFLIVEIGHSVHFIISCRDEA